MKPTENIAVIDIGSNTLRILIGQIQENRIKKLYSDRVVTRLGKNLIKTGFLDSEAIKTSIDTLKKFKKVSEKFNVSCIIAVGTSALREAKNSEYFCELVKPLGFNVEIISAKEEAYYTLLGVIDEELENEDSIFIVDIGGGSTEWIYYENQNIKMDSIPIGALKIKELFLNNEPYLKDEIFKAKEFIKKSIKSIPNFKLGRFIATGGTASTLAMVYLGISNYSPEKTHMIGISANEFKRLLEKMLSVSLKERKKIKGIPSDRADIICSGLLILESFMEHLNIDKVLVSENGILEGIMKNYKKFCYNSSL